MAVLEKDSFGTTTKVAGCTYEGLCLKGRGTWLTPSVKRLTLDLDLGHDLTVSELEPHIQR